MSFFDVSDGLGDGRKEVFVTEGVEATELMVGRGLSAEVLCGEADASFFTDLTALVAEEGADDWLRWERLGDWLPGE